MREEEKRDIENRVEAMAEKLAEEMGFTLVDVEWRGGLLRVFIDREGGITIREVERFSRVLSDLLDREDFIEESYVLEVSSPGLDRRLTKPRELNWALGRRVMVILKDGTTYRGVLDYYNEEEEEIGVGGRFFNLKDVATLKLDEI